MSLSETNSNGLVMPVSPMNGNGGYGWNDGSFWIIILFLFAFMGNGWGGYSSRRGRSRVTGRYVSRDDGSFGSYEGSNRSYHGSPMVEKLERMMEDARSEKERRMIEEWIDKAERM